MPRLQSNRFFLKAKHSGGTLSPNVGSVKQSFALFRLTSMQSDFCRHSTSSSLISRQLDGMSYFSLLVEKPHSQPLGQRRKYSGRGKVCNHCQG